MGGGLVSHLKRLLQYLHGKVFGFCWRISPFSSAVPMAADASIDCRGIMADGSATSRG